MDENKQNSPGLANIKKHFQCRQKINPKFELWSANDKNDTEYLAVH